LLDQLASTGEHITLDLARKILGTSTDQSVADLVDTIIAGQIGHGMDIIHAALDAGGDPRQYARQIVDHLRDALMCKLGNPHLVSGSSEWIELLNHQAASLATTRLMDLISRFNSAAMDSRNNWQPGLSLELALAGALLGQEDVPQSNPPAIAGNTPERVVQAEKTATPVDPVTTPQPPIKAKPAIQSGESIPAAPAMQSGDEISLAKIVQNWGHVRASVKKRKGQTEGLLNSCQPLGIKGNALVLGFATDILKKKMENAENIGITEQALEEVLGKKISVLCTLTNNKPGNMPRDHEVDSDGMVGTALRDLGGEVVDFH
jgi:DNA polymerase III subunit gamma/tau